MCVIDQRRSSSQVYYWSTLRFSGMNGKITTIEHSAGGSIERRAILTVQSYLQSAACFSRFGQKRKVSVSSSPCVRRCTGVSPPAAAGLQLLCSSMS